MKFSIDELNEKQKDILLENLFEKYNHRREYMRDYMSKARAEGKIKHWRTYRAEKNES